MHAHDHDSRLKFPFRSTVCVVGLGYIGLPTAGILASRGHQVIGVDVRPDVVETINQGGIHIEEPDLDCLIHDVVRKGNLRATTEPVEADAFILCVPTPIQADHSPDVSYVESAAKAIKRYVRKGNLIVLESTSPPATTEDVVVKHSVPAGFKVGRDVYVAHCPERVLPGRILIEAVENDRVVGGVTPACAEKAAELYRTFATGQIWTTNALAAEMTKLVENAYRDVNIAFANELSMLADGFGLDAREIIELANKHPRVNILNPGPGVGGHCISVDPWFLVHAAPDRTPLMRTARGVNDYKPHYVIEQVCQLVKQKRVKTIGCLGLTYKADVDDLRESPSLEIVRELRQRGVANVLACDPLITPDEFSEFPLASLEQVIDQADLLLLLTDHRQFKHLPEDVLRDKLIVDTRGTWRETLARLAGESQGLKWRRSGDDTQGLPAAA